MKVIFVTTLIAIVLFLLIISIDLLMGTKFSQLITKETDPFQVMEPPEYGLIIVFGIILVGNGISGFFKRKKKNSTGG